MTAEEKKKSLAEYDGMKRDNASLKQDVIKTQKQLDDRYKAKQRKDEADAFNKIVEEGKKEYDDKEKEFNAAKKEITDLQEKAKKLTEKADIKANTRARKLAEKRRDTAKTRMDELKKTYDELLGQKKARDEAMAFQD